MKLIDFYPTFINDYAVAIARNSEAEIKKKRHIWSRYLEPHFGHLDTDEVTPAHIFAYKASLRGLAPKTINNHLAVLRKMLNLAVELGHRTSPVVVRGERVPTVEHDWLEHDELSRLVSASRETGWYAQILLAGHTGMRLGEIRALTWDDIDLVARVIHVRRAAHLTTEKGTKTGKARKIPFGDEVYDALRCLPSRFADGRVFPSTSGGIMSDSSWVWGLHRTCRLAGLRRIGWHTLRHTFATHLSANGVEIKTVADLLGHSSIQMTMRYSQGSMDAKRAAIRRLEVA